MRWLLLQYLRYFPISGSRCTFNYLRRRIEWYFPIASYNLAVDVPSTTQENLTILTKAYVIFTMYDARILIFILITSLGLSARVHARCDKNPDLSGLPDREDQSPAGIFQLMQAAEKLLKFGQDRELVAFMGISGSGKSTLASFIGGQDDDLTSEKVTRGQFVINDKCNRTSKPTDTFTSYTLVPEGMIDPISQATYFDLPGFDDTREDGAFDIISTYLVKKVLDFADKIKLIFVINHSNVKFDSDRDKFMGLVKHVTTLVRNVTKFENSIALIATKVAKTPNSGNEFLTDEEEIDGIVDFLQTARSNLEKKRNAEGVKLVDIFLKRTNIGIFRKPEVAGPLTNIPEVQKNKRNIKLVVDTNVKFGAKSKDDFGYTLSENSKNLILRLREEVVKNTSTTINAFGILIQARFESKQASSSNFDELVSFFGKSILIDVTTLKTIADFTNFFRDYAKKFDVNVDNKDLTAIIDNQKSLDFLLEMSGDPNMKVDWFKVIFDGLQNTTEYLKNLYSWYIFVGSFIDDLSAYKVQQAREQYNTSSVLKQINKFYYDNTQTKIKLYELDTIAQFVNKVSITTSKLLRNIDVTKGQVSFFRKVLNATMNYPATKVSSCKEEAFVVKGHFVFLSRVVDELRKCSNQKRLIQIFALEKIFIDATWNLTANRGILSIIAPIWDTIGHKAEIVLDGADAEKKSQEKAHSAEHYGEDGKNGKPGLPGNSAGNFVGIVEEFIAPGSLTISAKGGNGADGQDGGDGKDGKDDGSIGVPAKYDFASESPCLRSSYYQCEKYNISQSGYYYFRIKPIIAGKDGNGSNGGHGGQGGEGGHGGQIIIADLNLSSESSLKKISKNGSNGKDGNGGRSGKPGLLAPDWIEKLVAEKTPPYSGKFYIPEYKVESRITQFDGRPYYKYGQPGIRGKYSDGTEKAKPAVPFEKPYAAVTNYKIFAREYLHGYIRETRLERFLEKIEDSTSVSNLYDTLGLVNELIELEGQFYKLRDRINFLPFYQSLLNRTLQYAKKLNSSSPEYKKVLAHLYTTILSKTTNYKKAQTRGGMIIAVEKYLKNLNEELEEFKELRNKVVVDKTKLNYKKEIDQKINEGKYLIDSVVSPETEAIFSNIDTTISSLINSVDLEKNRMEEKRGEVKGKLDKFKSQMGLRTMFGVIKGAALLLNFAGPFGVLASTVIGGSMMVAEPLIFEDGDSALPGMLEGLSKEMNKSLSKLRDIYKEKLETTKKQMEDVKSQIEKFQIDDPGYTEIKKSKQSASEILKLTEKILEGKDNLYSPEDLSTLHSNQNKLSDDLKAQQKEFDGKTEKQLAKRKKFVNRIMNVVSLADIPLETYKQIQNDEKKQEAMADALNKIDAKLNALNQYKQSIYNVIFPMFKSLDNDIRNTIKNLNGQSRFGLDVSKWHVQKTLKDVQFQLKTLISGDFEDKGEEVQHYVEKLLDGMTVIVSMYDRIEAYREHAEFASYIANIYSPEAGKISIEDPILGSAIHKLDATIKANQILFEYDAGIETFTQYMFPFADRFLKQFPLPDSLKYNANQSFVVDLVSATKTKINGLIKSINEWHDIIGKYDKYVVRNVWFGDINNKVPPLMVWKYEDYGDDIEKLLNGKYVTLTADIERGIDANAIKFNVLWFQFNSSDPIADKLLYKTLKDYSWEMVHGGNSYYRCNNKYYVTYHEKLNASCFVEPFAESLPSGTNEVYDKIRNNDYILSPFATWTLRLVPNNLARRRPKRSINVTKAKFNLELKGKGQYVKLDPSFDLCNDDLNKYYTEINWKI